MGLQTVDGVHVQVPHEAPNREGEYYRNEDSENVAGEFTWPNRTTVDIDGMVRDAFMRFDDIHNDILNDEQFVHVPNIDMNEEGDANLNTEFNVESLLRDSREKIFEGSNLNRLQCIIVLYSLCSLYSVPNTFVNALLAWLAGDVLPTSNCFPRTSYEMKTILMKWGLKHRQVHTCPEGHLLYEGENEHLEECPTCQHPRYIPGSNKIPQRVVRYFDIMSHLVRMFKCPEIAKLMLWHSNHKSRDGKMRSVVDSEQWKTIDRLYPDFAEVLTNLRLGLVGDGIIPFKNNAMKHSTWVLLITIYNLPPWLLTKKFFISLAVLIPGPTAPIAENMDIFLAPVVRDLMKLWNGVPAMNMSKLENERRFILRAILMWTINDFPAYSFFSGQQVHRYKACPLCGPETCAEHARLLGKMIFLGARRYLPGDHRFRRARTTFNMNEEWLLAPQRPSGEEVLRWGSQRSQFLANGGVQNSNEDPVKLHGVKRQSIFFQLPYWEVS